MNSWWSRRKFYRVWLLGSMHWLDLQLPYSFQKWSNAWKVKRSIAKCWKRHWKLKVCVGCWNRSHWAWNNWHSRRKILRKKSDWTYVMRRMTFVCIPPNCSKHNALTFWKFLSETTFEFRPIWRLRSRSEKVWIHPKMHWI